MKLFICTFFILNSTLIHDRNCAGFPERLLRTGACIFHYPHIGAYVHLHTVLPPGPANLRIATIKDPLSPAVVHTELKVR